MPKGIWSFYFLSIAGEARNRKKILIIIQKGLFAIANSPFSLLFR